MGALMSFACAGALHPTIIKAAARDLNRVLILRGTLRPMTVEGGGAVCAGVIERYSSAQKGNTSLSRTKGARDLDYDAKRRDLLERMTLQLARREGERASFRDLASAAGVSGPTLRHYFGDRRAVIEAVLAECLRRGRPTLEAQRATTLPLGRSIRAYAGDLVAALTAEKSVRLGDIFALSLAEGLIDPTYGRPALEHILEPTLQVLEARLSIHIERGELRRDTDPRVAALQLVSPLLLACLHQNQLDGLQVRPLDLQKLVEDTCQAFLRAHAEAPSPPAARSAALARAS